MKKSHPLRGVPIIVLVTAIIMTTLSTACQPQGSGAPTPTLKSSIPSYMSTRTPRPTYTPLPTQTLTPTLPPTQMLAPLPTYIVPTAPASTREITGIPTVLLDDWDGFVAETVCLNKTPDLPYVSESIKETLQNMGIAVVDEDQICDATLALNISARALSANYTSHGKCYSGASVEAQITFSHNVYATAAFSFENKTSPPIGLMTCNKDPEKAPFTNLWLGDTLKILGEIWGQDAYLASLNVTRFKAKALYLLNLSAPTDMMTDYLLFHVANPSFTKGIDYSQTVELIKYWHLQEAIPYLRTNLYTSTLDWKIRIASAETLDHFDILSEVDFPVLYDLFEKKIPDDEYVHISVHPYYETIASLLGSTQPPELVIPYMLNFLSPAEWPGARQAAAITLMEAGDEGLKYTFPLLTDESDEVRYTVEERLINMGPEIIRPLWEYIEANEHQSDNHAALAVLSFVSGQGFGDDFDQWRSWWEAVENQAASITRPSQFSEALSDPEIFIRYTVLKKIITIGPNWISSTPDSVDTISALKKMIEEEQYLWWFAVQALIAIGEDVYPAITQTILSDNIPTKVKSVFYIELGKTGPQAIDSVPALIDNLTQRLNYVVTYNNKGPLVHELLVYALNRITGVSFGGDVDAWQNWWASQQ